MALLCCRLVVEFSVGIGAFVIGLNQILFFFSLLHCLTNSQMDGCCFQFSYVIFVVLHDMKTH